MNSLEYDRETHLAVPRIFEIYFMDKDAYRGIKNRTFSKAVGDYQLCFGVRSDISHVAVRLGDYIYELAEEGLVKYEYTEKILSNERVVAFYSSKITDRTKDSRSAAAFVVESYLGNKLDIDNCLGYLRKYWQLKFSCISEDKINSYAQDLTLDSGSIDPAKGKFKLPFTCVSPANIVIDFLYNIEPSFRGHLAGDLYETTHNLVESNLGILYIGC
jgi:hypothetical protein